jgi:hypothetical protein
VLVLAGAFATVMMDVRLEHVDVVHRRSVGWMPIACGGFMTAACLCAFTWWTTRARRALIPLFALAMCIGGAGFYFHNGGNVRRVVADTLGAWVDREMTHSDDPPQLAPLAFCGLGAIGILASLGRFNPHRD